MAAWRSTPCWRTGASSRRGARPLLPLRFRSWAAIRRPSCPASRPARARSATGLSIGLGMALAARMTGRDSKVYVLMGDGEINEGSVWEAAACADKHHLSNLTVIIDYNKIQSAGSVFEIQNMEPLADKWTSLRLPRVRVQRPRRRRAAAGLPRCRRLRRRPAARGHLPHGQGQGHSGRREQSRLASQVRPLGEGLQAIRSALGS